MDSSTACGNVNGDDAIDISDGIHLLAWLFLGGPPLICGDGVSGCGDPNADGETDLSDVVYILGWLFLDGPSPQCALGCEAPAIDGFTSLGCNTQRYPEYRHDQTGIVFIRLPGGTFNMGSLEGEPYHEVDEGPLHEVTLSPFLIAKYEVTQTQWQAVMGNNPSEFTGDGNRPVEHVSWDNIQAFEATTGLGLPTEAQWEYACRAGQSEPYSGTGNVNDMGWYDDNSGMTTHPVGEKAPNQFGLYDMHGNVWEWCEDVYSSGFYSTGEASGPDPVCTSGSEYQVVRGGCWGCPATDCHSAYRSWFHSSSRDFNLGLRPSKSLP